MTYNRCVGTRYCLNNCPYKVRRFNFLNYHTDQRSPLDLVFNPDVTNRMRGVMEKCTFCVQRLHEAKYHAKDQGRARINDGEAVTACQEACPASAIIFGDMNDPNSRVSQMRSHERSFTVLAELNVRPAVTYLAKVQNAPARPAKDGHH
jgi:molybdopterin-containing oxidoreductase family iron-sulfur binding subunit